MLSLTSCGESTRGRIPAGTPVILISVDTLRADHLSIYTETELPTPAFEALARDGIVFEQAFSHVPLTLPSHLSILTGRLPHHHGVRSNAGYTVGLEGQPYLPRILAGHGYSTAGAVSAYPLSRNAGFGADFDVFDDADGFAQAATTGLFQRPGDETLGTVLPWLRAQDDRPFFLFFHLFEPHSPYEPAPAFAAAGRSAYDGEIVAADFFVGRLLDELRRLGLYDHALIMLLSDHGEGLGDHGEMEHGMLLYHEVLRVPWIIKLPESRQAGTLVQQPVGLIDVLPTVLELLGMETPESVDGRSQAAALFGHPDREPRAILSETLFPRIEMGWSELWSVIHGSRHLIEGPELELYDWSRDPAETTNVADDRRREVAELRGYLRDADMEFAAADGASRESGAALSALGYVGSSTKTPDPSVSPRDRIHIYETFRAGKRAFLQQDWATAEGLLRAAADADPDLVDARLLQGSSLQRLGKQSEALDIFVRHGPGSDRAVEIAAEVLSLCRRLGRTSQCPDYLAAFVDAEPADPRLHSLRVPALTASGRLAEALEEAETVVRSAPESPDGYFLRATVRSAQNLKDEAIDDLRRAVEASDEKHVPAMLELSILLHARGEHEEARRLVELARFIDPDAPSVLAVSETLGLI